MLSREILFAPLIFLILQTPKEDPNNAQTIPNHTNTRCLKNTNCIDSPLLVTTGSQVMEEVQGVHKYWVSQKIEHFFKIDLLTPFMFYQ